MISTHKVLAAYGCLAPRVVTGQFDPTHHRAIWPSTGNYARGGVAISRLMASRGVAILPTGMSRERFDWLDRWCENPAEDVIRTVGTESNVKEIYDECNRLAHEPENFVFNQFAEFGNHLVHYAVTGPALAHVFEAHRAAGGRRRAPRPDDERDRVRRHHRRRRALKDTYGTKVLAAEALECPTLLENGYGEHNIQGIGDKHVPSSTTSCGTTWSGGERPGDRPPRGAVQRARGPGPPGRARACPTAVLAALADFGFSSICNVLAAISAARCSTSARTTSSSPWRRTAAACTGPSGRRSSGATSAASSPDSTRPGLGRAPRQRPDRCHPRAAPSATATASSTWATTPGSSSRAPRSSSSSAGAARPSGAGSARTCRVWDELITDFNARVAAGCDDRGRGHSASARA